MVDATNAEDEYALYDDFSDLTEEQLAQIDAATSSALASTSKSIPHVQIELEGIGTSNHTSSNASKTKEADRVTPLQQFRKNNILSVTDLVSPAWCEVQFDYGLRQQRHRRLKDRPASFVTELGKEIVVDSGVAAKSDATKKKGASVHKKLEREIRPEEISVQVNIEEERWGLRIINMIDCIDSLLLLGCAREIPVFGLVEGKIVVGIIDEITFSQVPPSPHNYDKKHGLQSLPSTPQKPKRTRRSPSPSQSRITSFMSPTKASAVETPFTSDSSSPSSAHVDLHTLRLIDNKTRRTNSLPRDEDTLPSRLQLMLYHRMFTHIMATSITFDFSSFWQKLELDDTALFSQTFLAQTLLTPEITCLHHLTDLWHVAVSRLNGARISSTLQLVYRLQPGHSTRKRSSPRKNLNGNVTCSQEEIEIAKAIEASMRDVWSVPKDEQKLAQNLVQSLTDTEAGSSVIEQDKNLVDEPELLWALEQSLLTHLNETGIDFVTQSPAQNVQSSTTADISAKYQPTETHYFDIIGIKDFEFDAQYLDEYLVDIMKWWNGDRKPVGVSLEQSGRCFSCEYRFGCEWREQKAREVEEGLKSRRQQKNASS
ncbi:exonuclease V [Lentinula aciculospora]|uniref:Exonuclease V n=1 Tax=Lentinula aciculospora TaxID=153920 RepID=A0A9W9DTG4_9AGAR|nr:exonuclease V [Lentinula aciculospora]